jgi:hypothetical protein
MKKIKLLDEIDSEPRRRPYAACVDFLLGEDVEFSLEYPVTLLVTPTAIIQLKLAPEQPVGALQHFKKYRVEIEGFAKASEAETAGLRLATVLLWAAVSKRFTMRLDYHTPLPCVVYDRTASRGGITCSATARSYWPLTPHTFSGLLSADILESSSAVDNQLLLSMELFAAARLEISDRARFISLVSSLEPLASQRTYPDSLKNIVERFQQEVAIYEIPEVPESDAARLKTSITARLSELQRESIRQAILRNVRELLPDNKNALRIIDEAYALRSRILHEGGSDPYLDQKISEIEDTIRLMFAARIGKELIVPPMSAAQTT